MRIESNSVPRMKVTLSPGRISVWGFLVRSVAPFRVMRTFPFEMRRAAPVRVFCSRVRYSQRSKRQESSCVSSAVLSLRLERCFGSLFVLFGAFQGSQSCKGRIFDLFLGRRLIAFGGVAARFRAFEIWFAAFAFKGRFSAPAGFEAFLPARGEEPIFEIFDFRCHPRFVRCSVRIDGELFFRRCFFGFSIRYNLCLWRRNWLGSRCFGFWSARF